MPAAIKNIAFHVPKKILTNETLAELYTDWTASKIEAKTGIKSRHIAEPGETSVDLAVAAAERLFSYGTLRPSDVDFILFCTQSPDFFLPTSACLIQERLGLQLSTGAFDINLGCSGFVYGLAVAQGLIEAGHAKNILFLTSETYSKFIHPDDKSVRTLFGDGAAATWIGAVEGGPRVGPFVFGTDGKGAMNLCVPTGGFREPRTAESSIVVADTTGNRRSRDNLFMDGAEVFAFTLKIVPDAVQAILEKARCSMDDVDLFIFHQANAFLLEHLRQKIGIPTEKFIVDVEDIGNTVSSSIPIALRRALDTGRVVAGSRIVIVGFGVGYSWSAAVLTW